MRPIKYSYASLSTTISGVYRLNQEAIQSKILGGIPLLSSNGRYRTSEDVITEITGVLEALYVIIRGEAAELNHYNPAYLRILCTGDFSRRIISNKVGYQSGSAFSHIVRMDNEIAEQVRNDVDCCYGRADQVRVSDRFDKSHILWRYIEPVVTVLLFKWT